MFASELTVYGEQLRVLIQVVLMYELFCEYCKRDSFRICYILERRFQTNEFQKIIETQVVLHTRETSILVELI